MAIVHGLSLRFCQFVIFLCYLANIFILFPKWKQFYTSQICTQLCWLLIKHIVQVQLFSDWQAQVSKCLATSSLAKILVVTFN